MFAQFCGRLNKALTNLTIIFEVEVVLSSSFTIQLRRFTIFFNDNDKMY